MKLVPVLLALFLLTAIIEESGAQSCNCDSQYSSCFTICSSFAECEECSEGMETCKADCGKKRESMLNWRSVFDPEDKKGKQREFSPSKRSNKKRKSTF